MKKNKVLKKYIDILDDVTSVNGIIFACNAVCTVIYAVMGYFIFKDPGYNDASWKPIMYYILLFLPVLLASVDYAESKYKQEFKYSLYLPSLFFYAYLLFFEQQPFHFLYAICMIGMSVIYCDIRFSGLLGTIVFTLHMIFAIMNFEQEKGKLMSGRFFDAGLVLVMIFFFNFTSGIIVAIRNAKMADVNEEKQRFVALASVDEKWIFEYDIEKDRMNITQNVGGSNEQKLKVDHISKEAKLQRYVLYADWEELDRFLEECKAGRPILEAQMRLRNHKADYLWYQLKARTLFDKNNEPVSVIGTMENIDDRKRMELRIADENMRDPLTKLYENNHAKELMSEFLSTQEGTEYAGVLLVDVDDYSSLIEKMGTTFADEVLKSMATDLDEIFYTSDVLGRVGGDQFIILMKNIKKIPDIEKKMQEIQDVVHKIYSESEMRFATTVTIGASVFPIDGRTYDELYHNAEKALVYEKEQGKNRYGLYDHEKEPEYAKLHIEEKHNKIQYQHELDMTYEHTESDSLMELAFKLIDESKDTDSAINLLLRQVARRMGLDAIWVRHRVGREHRMFYPYRCIMGDFPIDEEEIYFSDDGWEEAVGRIKAANGYSCYSKVDENTGVRASVVYKKLGIRSFARCSYFEKDEYIGSIDFISYTDEREWTKEDKQTIQAVTNVISSYLLKMKAYEDAEDEIERLTGYDAITGFYKYEKFLENAQEYLQNAKPGQYAIAYQDFSNFKYINETYGYEVGDKILREYAEMLPETTKRFIMGSRVFSDNIVSLFDATDADMNDMVSFAEYCSSKFADKVQKEYFGSNVVCVVGLCPFVVTKDEDIPLKNIISNANLARKEAKRPEKANVIIYDESMGENLLKEVKYANEMEDAFRNKEFLVYMQPKVDLKQHKIIGAEALIRWVKPSGEILYPNEFIPVFEKNKSITMLDYFVYDEVCKYLADRAKKNEPVVSISVNVSRVHLQSIDEMVQYVKALLKKYKIKPEYLEFELTETMSTEKVEDTIKMLNKLRKLGVKVSMDDFGSGYSSLNLLTKLPLDVLKLDKEFLKDFEKDSDGKIIIPSIIDMAKKLKLEVVCEGVETKEQVEFLRDVDCDIVQGYYYSKPVPLDVFTEMLSDNEFIFRQEE